MNEFLIIGSGFSALVSYLRLKKFNPLVISTNINTFNDNFLKRRKNLDTNKFFSKKSKSFGNFEYQIPHNIKFHDRNSFGGNTNIWGGFINIENLSNKFIKLSRYKLIFYLNILHHLNLNWHPIILVFFLRFALIIS